MWVELRLLSQHPARSADFEHIRRAASLQVLGSSERRATVQRLSGYSGMKAIFGTKLSLKAG